MKIGDRYVYIKRGMFVEGVPAAMEDVQIIGVIDKINLDDTFPFHIQWQDGIGEWFSTDCLSIRMKKAKIL